MALTLVPRHIRALSEHLNSIIRVLRGTDRDSLWLWLASGGSFEVRHSVTGAAVLQVTDAGATLTGAIGLPAQSITSAMIANGTIQGADIAPATITSDKLVTGAAITPGSITSTELQDGGVQTVDLAANAVNLPSRLAINTGAMAPGGPFDVSGSGINIFCNAGETCIFNFNGTVTAATAGAIVGVTYVPGSATPVGISLSVPTANQPQPIAISDVVVGTTANGLHKLQYSSNVGTVALLGRMHIIVLKR